MQNHPPAIQSGITQDKGKKSCDCHSNKTDEP